MKCAEEVLISIVRDGINGKNTLDDPEYDLDKWDAVFQLAREHELLPLVFDTCCGLSSLRKADKENENKYKELSIKAAVRQIIQTNEFLTLLLRAQKQGLDPVVLKGVVCRSLYPKPMLRPSVDEDILIPASQAEAFHAFLLDQGLFADEPGADVERAFELSYHKENSPTYIELHTTPFPPDNEAYGDLNELFEGIFDRTIRVQIEDVSVRTLAPTDHLLYILCHAYKHFLHGGIGLRQVCDIGMMARAYGEEIHWKNLLSQCERIRIERFSAAIFKIGGNCFGLPVPSVFDMDGIDEKHLLEDILSGGNYGVSDIDRVHSASITLDAAASRGERRRSGSLLAAVFPKRSSLEGRYPYLKTKPWLLPAAWGQRIAKYILHRDGLTKGNPSRSIQIGRERVELLREYGIID